MRSDASIPTPASPVPGTACPYPAWATPVKVPLTVFPEHPCSYLPGRVATSRGFWAHEIPAGLYHRFMDAGFRRSGKLIYQPVCQGCRACLPIRVPVKTFSPDKSQRRCARKNADLCVTVGPPSLTEEKAELYRRYITQWHGGEPQTSEELAAFLYGSPVDTVEFVYRDARQKLTAVGICDICPESLSSVYFYFDPSEANRSPGTYGALVEVAYARSAGIPYYYLGYWVDQCQSMSYKCGYQPNEVLHPDGIWRPGRGALDVGEGVEK
ncbi:MAG: putative arginyl-tRNA:protein arginylyltransferase [Phycisphaerales bacterium]|nr:putative arginyl-tRNA:protein arginylyltransferase [Phycisphaerales bacterium]MDB5330339.1 putative arginyl-tRNA:protein arginylyltransferase [Phycisphaerales bacterium]